MPTDNFFTPLLDEDKRTNILSTISSPVWSGGATTLTAFYTSSVQSGSSGDYYYDVYDKAQTDTTRQVQFAVSYGHIDGSGSLSTTAGNNPSKAIYRQFRNICIKNSSSETRFNFDADGEGTTYDASAGGQGYDIFAINVNRARYREKIDPGNWELHLAKGGNSLSLIDDSGATADSSINASKRIFNVVEGSISTGTAVYTTPASAQTTINSAGSFGYFFPELGIIILNAFALKEDDLALTVTRTSDVNDDTSKELFNAISGSDNTGYFQARREEQIKSSHYFCRVKSEEYNWSQNPTYYTGDDAEIRNATFIQDPKSYITTVGLYNNQNELLAVAKLSQPLLKSRDREAVIKVRLDF